MQIKITDEQEQNENKKGNMNKNKVACEYILISPVKNEELYLSEVIESIIRQTIKPRLWVIVDDGSVDRTPEIINKYKNIFNWIKSISLPESPHDVYLHYAHICRVGFEYAINYCKKNNIHYDFIGLIDGDTVLESKYFEKLIDEFKKDAYLGIASGGIYYESSRGLIWEKTDENFPRGTGRLWSKDCFFDTKGYPLDPAMHTISNTMAVLRGYNTKQFKDIVAIEKRKTCSVGGFWKRHMKAGELAYYLNKHPILILLNTIYLTCHYPFYTGIAYLIGYILSFIRRKNKIKDTDIRHYFYNERIKEIFLRKR